MFNFRDHGVLDFYTPLFTASPAGAADSADALRAFLAVTARGLLGGRYLQFLLSTLYTNELLP